MTDVQRDQIRNLSKDGYGYKKIASFLELSESTVKSYCRRHDIRRRKPKVVHDLCRECGEKLYNTPGHRQRNFCSDDCRKKYWKEHRDEIKRGGQIEIVCPVCGHKFTDYAKKGRKYCSLWCYQMRRRKND